jgi:hypothetical protein
LTRLQDAFLEFGAAQCGICTPGMLMSAAALLDVTPAPTKQQVEDALGGVLCRCTGYAKIIDAVLFAAGSDARARALATGQVRWPADPPGRRHAQGRRPRKLRRGRHSGGCADGQGDPLATSSCTLQDWRYGGFPEGPQPALLL